jgi:PAS domain S-box-containing protein
MKNSVDTGFMIRDFRAFECTPGVSVVVTPDSPDYTLVAVSNDFIELTGLKRDAVIGKGHFSFFPKNPDDPNFTGEKNLRASFEFIVKNRIPHELENQRYDFRGKDGKFNFKYWNVKNVPILNEEGSVAYIIHTAVDVTESVKTERELESIKGIQKAYEFFKAAPVIIGYVRGENYVIEFANEGLLKVWSRSSDVIGKPLFDALPELKDQGTKQLLDEVCRTGQPFFAYEHPLTFYRDGLEETLYFNFVYQPFYEDGVEGKASGVISVGHDVTEQVNERQKFKNVVQQANDPILILKGRNMVLEVANDALYRLWKIDKSALGKSFLQILPEMEGQGFLELLQNVYNTGETFHGFETPAVFEDSDGNKRTVYVNFTYQPYREPDGNISGVLVLSSDVTAQVLAKRQAEESQQQWKDLANSMPAILWTTGGDGSPRFFNHRWYEFTGLTEEQSLHSGWTSVLHPDDGKHSRTIWDHAVKTGTPYEVELRYKNKQGDYRWMIARGVPIKQDGKVVSWYGTSVDIHEKKQLEFHLEEKVRERTEQLEAKNKVLDNILQYSSNGITVSEMIRDESGNVVDAMTILANDAAVKFSGIPKDLYLTKRATVFDPNIISSPYGQACLKTLRTGEPSIMQYFLEFRSRWLELTISRMDENHLIHIFTDVTPIKEAQLQLEKSLQELQYANANLEEFAYAASHDLKEPARKLQFYSNRLKEDLKEKLNPAQINLFERLESSSNRMQNLIHDLLEYSHAAHGSSEYEVIDLEADIKHVLEDLELEIQKKQARIRLDSLPTIKGNKRQMQQLFQNLLSNALKYSKQGVAPEIAITSRRMLARDVKRDLPIEAGSQLCTLIEVSDNGIGFDQKDADRIFKVFTRLATDGLYRGSGVGLSIVRKVVESHQGFVWAESEPGKGSTFKILLPAV